MVKQILASLIEYNELNDDIIAEVDRLSISKYVFKISDMIFPYI